MIYKYNPIEDCYATKKKIYIFRNEIEKFILKNKNIALLDFGCGNANDCGKFLISPEYKYIGFDSFLIYWNIGVRGGTQTGYDIPA